MKFVKILFLLIGLFSSGQSSNILLGYYPSWNQNIFSADDIRWNNLTHICHAFVWPQSDGSLAYENGFFYPALNRKAHEKGKKILFSIGGASMSYNFSAVLADTSKRARFINDIVHTVQNHNYDGVDIDWEFPESEADKNNLVTFIGKLNSRLQEANPDYLLTMAIPSGDYYGKWFRYDVLTLLVDWFNVMTYDYHGSWTSHSGHNAPLFAPPNDVCGSVDETIRYLMNTRKITGKKLCLGLAFYGRLFNSSGLYHSSTGGDETYGYKDIVNLIGQGWSYHWDDISKVPYLTNNAGDQLITYDDTTSVRLKCEYLLNKELKGGMIWALGHDQMTDAQQPLLQTAAHLLLAPQAIGPEPRALVPQAADLRVYPNPFNNSTTIAYQLQQTGYFEISLFSISGRKIGVLKSGNASKGNHLFSWNGKRQASGIYYLVLRQNNKTIIRSMVLIK